MPKSTPLFGLSTTGTKKNPLEGELTIYNRVGSPEPKMQNSFVSGCFTRTSLLKWRPLKLELSQVGLLLQLSWGNQHEAIRVRSMGNPSFIDLIHQEIVLQRPDHSRSCMSVRTSRVPVCKSLAILQILGGHSQLAVHARLEAKANNGIRFCSCAIAPKISKVHSGKHLSILLS